MKSKLDRLFASYQQTVAASSQSQATQLESLTAENQQLRAQVGELEIETLRQFSELEDCEELIVAMDERRLPSHKEASAWKLECERLTKEVVFLKETIEKYKHKSGLQEWGFRNEKPKESLLKEELSAKAGINGDRDTELGRIGSNKENSNNAFGECGSRTALEEHGGNENNPSLIAARGIFGKAIPTSFLNTKYHRDDRYRGMQYDSNRRKSFHGMTLRERQTNKKYLS